MEPNEIVEHLVSLAMVLAGKEHRANKETELLDSAIDCIEQLQAELEQEVLRNKALTEANKRAYDDGFSDCKKADDTLIANLRRELEASKRRERAAVEDLTRMANGYKDCGGCAHIVVCINKSELKHTGVCYEWRGPEQEGE